MDGTRSASHRARAALANPRDHLQGIKMSRVKFRADPLKTVAVHKEQRTDRQRSTLAPTALGHTSRIRRSILAPAALAPSRLRLASSEFPVLRPLLVLRCARQEFANYFCRLLINLDLCFKACALCVRRNTGCKTFTPSLSIAAD